MKRIILILAASLTISGVIMPNLVEAKTAKIATKQAVATKIQTVAPRFITFADGSKLNLDTKEVTPVPKIEIKSIETKPIEVASSVPSAIDTKSAVSYAEGVGLIYCEGKNSDSMGSGWIVKATNPNRIAIYTNYHVIQKNSVCYFQVRNITSNITKSSTIKTNSYKEMPNNVFAGGHWLSTDTAIGRETWRAQLESRQNYKANIVVGNDDSQFAIFSIDSIANKDLRVEPDFIEVKLGKRLAGNLSIDSLNYSLGELKRCGPDMPIGSKVVAIGYPAYSTKWIYDDGIASRAVAQRQITEGEITGFDRVFTTDTQLHTNYFISAKIDAGNSGGVALSSNENGVCILGIPTWTIPGVYENQGVVQNIANIPEIK